MFSIPVAPFAQYPCQCKLVSVLVFCFFFNNVVLKGVRCFDFAFA